jgi:hypothetical protein
MVNKIDAVGLSECIIVVVIPAWPESFLLFAEGFPTRFTCGNDSLIG